MNFRYLFNPKIILIIITLVAVFFRTWMLSEYPVSLSLDEAIVGYDAYSILKTAKDHHGHFLPIVFESIGDYKSPVLIYAIIPAIAIWGLTEFGVRITVALTGAFTVLAVYWLIKELLYSGKLKDKSKEIIALTAAFSAAISPWHIQPSRFSHDVVLGVFFFIISVALFLFLLRKNPGKLWISFLLFVLSAYTYHSLKLIAPLILGGLIVIYRHSFLKLKKQFTIGIIIAGLASLPLLYLMTTEAGQRRASVTSIAKDVEINSEFQAAVENHGFIESTFNNPGLVLGNFWVKRFLNYWDLNYLFFKGSDLTLADNPDVGLLQLIELPFFLLGLWQLVFHSQKYFINRKFKLIIYWLILGPIAASLANNDQHPYRSLNWIPMPQLLVGIGLITFIMWVKKKNLFLKISCLSVGILILSYNLAYFVDIYFHHSPIQHSEYWQYGMKQFAQYADQNRHKYQEIIIDPKFGSNGPYTEGVPHAYILFYSQYDPRLFQADPRRAAVNFGTINFANYTFRPIYWPKDRLKENSLFIGSPWSLPSQDVREDQILQKIYFKNGSLGFLIVETE